MSSMSQPVTARQASSPRAAIVGTITGSHIRLWLVIVAIAVCAGTVGYLLIERWDVLAALYMTVITLTTVGFREVEPLGAAGQIWTMVLAVVGVGLIFGSVGIVAEFLVSEVTSGRREAKRMLGQVAALRDHFILCGYGRVGSTVARELVHSGQRVVVIDVLQESVARAHGDGHLTVAGDATDDATLRAAGIERARGLITTIDSDAHNVYVILSARAINPRLFVVGRANAAGSEGKLLQAGADRVVSPYTMAGHRLAELAIRPRVVDFIDAALSHGELAFSMEELEVRPGGELDGRTVGELRERGIFVLAVVAGERQYEANPPADRRLESGEGLVVSGAVSVLASLRGRV